MRKFEKISFEQYKKDVCDNLEDYNNFNLPKRSTKYSAGYDFEASQNYVIKPNEIVKIPTGIKVTMNQDEMLMIVVRSSMGFKYNVRMCNQVGIIESDYYNNESNEGHMWVALQNHGTNDYIINKGDKFAQGIFVKFLTVDNEEEIKTERKGGFGSTTKEG
ncbi:MAG: dUTP diphosphatase [Bacilli bacterium]|nr:dUTP diphosphatase [Bacilli bacterium]